MIFLFRKGWRLSCGLHCWDFCKKIVILICSVMLFSSEIVYYLHKCIIQPCIEYCYDAWAGVASLEPLAGHQDVGNLILFCRYCFDRSSIVCTTHTPSAERGLNLLPNLQQGVRWVVELDRTSTLRVGLLE